MGAGRSRYSARDPRVDSRRMTDGPNVRLIRELFSVGNRAAETGRPDDWLNFFSQDVLWESVKDAPDAGTYRGHEGIRGYFEDWLNAVDGPRQDPRELTEIGDCIVADIHFTARIKGTDTEIALDYCGVSLIEDGKITRIKEFREHDDAVAYAEGFARGGS
jgi:ketosteroid isomerase-like protein